MESSRKPFFGRERALFEIVQGALAPHPQSFSLIGPKLIGKSHLLRYLATDEGPLLSGAAASPRPLQFQDSSRVLVTWVDCDWQDAQENLIGWVYKTLQVQVRDHYRIELNWAQIERQPAPSRRLWHLARTLNEREFRLVVLMDNFDRVFENQQMNAETVDELRPLTLELSLLVATEQPLHDLDRELAASPLFNVMTQLFMGLLEPAVAREWVLSYAEDFPGVTAVADDLVQLTGMHPFLLRRLGDILVEVRQMVPGGGALLGSAHLPLLRLRLAEHGRLLFETIWKRLQQVAPRNRPEVVQALIKRLTEGPLPMAGVPLEQVGALNWLINQAIITCCMEPEIAGATGVTGYQFFTPLFTEFLKRRTAAETAAAETAAAGSLAASPFALPAPSPVELDQLTKTETLLFRYLQAHRNETISTEQLLAEVWKRPDANNRRVQEAVRRLRLELANIQPPIGVIENDRGRGYRFVPA